MRSDDDDFYLVVLPWSAADYCRHLPARAKGFSGSLEERMETMFPPMFSLPFPMIDTPCIIVDNTAAILFWYLPRSLTLTRQVNGSSALAGSCSLTFESQQIIWDATFHLQPSLKGGKNHGNWRSLDNFFRPRGGDSTLPPGVVNLSPGWFELGHDVRCQHIIICILHLYPDPSLQGPQDTLCESASLKPGHTAQGGRAWLTAIGESAALLSSVLRVIHPDLYAMARQSMDEMSGELNLAEILQLWMSVFNGVSVISNRETPVHRDHSSASEWYDLLTTIGPYDSAVFELPGVGLRFMYQSGTIIGFCGRVLRHGVSEAGGERLCLAYYMRANVQKRLGSLSAGWNHWDRYHRA